MDGNDYTKFLFYKMVQCSSLHSKEIKERINKSFLFRFTKENV